MLRFRGRATLVPPPDFANLPKQLKHITRNEDEKYLGLLMILTLLWSSHNPMEILITGIRRRRCDQIDYDPPCGICEVRSFTVLEVIFRSPSFELKLKSIRTETSKHKCFIYRDTVVSPPVTRTTKLP